MGKHLGSKKTVGRMKGALKYEKEGLNSQLCLSSVIKRYTIL